MSDPPSNNPNVKLLACLTDIEDESDSDYRCLVDGKDVKYLTTAPGAFRDALDDRTFEPILIHQLFPTFPPGDWNHGHLAWDETAGKAAFVTTEVKEYPGVKNLWHETRFDELDFTMKYRLNQQVRVCTNPKLLDGAPVLVKFAVWPWEVDYSEDETTAYQWLDIHNCNVGPKFLGHLTERPSGRVIGFVTELISDFRHAQLADYNACRKALLKLHALGIKLGDTNRHNLLVRENCAEGEEEVVLVDFEMARRGCTEEELEEELRGLKESLEYEGTGGRPQSIGPQ